ncbi:MAG: FMN-binding negative transcriptional regulator [Rhizomicrobium sp.]
MYQPRVFREEQRARLHDVIERHSFGTLVVASQTGELDISHVPVLLDRERGRLGLHVAAANPIWKKALESGRATVIFGGPHAYVSASWYETPSEQVPTWNYVVVHASGAPRKMDRDELLALLDGLVSANESNDAKAWSTRVLDAAVRDELLLQIVGLSIEIATLEGKFKLSQNRSEGDRQRVIAALRARGTPDDLALVALMTP